MSWLLCALVEISMRWMGHLVAHHFLLKQLLKFALKWLLYIQIIRVVLKDGKLCFEKLTLVYMIIVSILVKEKTVSNLRKNVFSCFTYTFLKAMIKHRLLVSQRLICSPLSSSCGLSAPYLGFVFRLRALKPANMAVRVS